MSPSSNLIPPPVPSPRRHHDHGARAPPGPRPPARRGTANPATPADAEPKAPSYSTTKAPAGALIDSLPSPPPRRPARARKTAPADTSKGAQPEVPRARHQPRHDQCRERSDCGTTVSGSKSHCKYEPVVRNARARRMQEPRSRIRRRSLAQGASGSEPCCGSGGATPTRRLRRGRHHVCNGSPTEPTTGSQVPGDKLRYRRTAEGDDHSRDVSVSVPVTGVVPSPWPSPVPELLPGTWLPVVGSVGSVPGTVVPPWPGAGRAARGCRREAATGPGPGHGPCGRGGSSAEYASAPGSWSRTCPGAARTCRSLRCRCRWTCCRKKSSSCRRSWRWTRSRHWSCSSGWPRSWNCSRPSTRRRARSWPCSCRTTGRRAWKLAVDEPAGALVVESDGALGAVWAGAGGLRRGGRLAGGRGPGGARARGRGAGGGGRSGGRRGFDDGDVVVAVRRGRRRGARVAGALARATVRAAVAAGGRARGGARGGRRAGRSGAVAGLALGGRAGGGQARGDDGEGGAEQHATKPVATRGATGRTRPVGPGSTHCCSLRFGSRNVLAV